MPALETLQQASGGRLELVFGDMLKIDERDLLKNEPKAENWADGARHDTTHDTRHTHTKLIFVPKPQRARCA
jgi:hypothetical protein